MRFRFLIRKRLFKLYQSVVKRILFLKYGSSAFYHMHSYWPMTKLQTLPHGEYNIFHYGNLIAKTHSHEELKRNSNSQIVIIGAGPSVNLMDLNKIRPNSAILVNGAISLIKQLPSPPLITIIMDQGFVIKNLRMLQNIPKESNLLLSLDSLGVILKLDKSIIKNNKIYLTPNIFTPYMKAKRNLDTLQITKCYKNSECAFSTSPDYGFWDGGTVVTWAVQLAYYLQSQSTFIMGMDLGDKNEQHFYETAPDPHQKSALLENYNTKILPFFKLASTVFKNHQLPIFNCSPRSKLPYEIIPYNDYFLNKT